MRVRGSGEHPECLTDQTRTQKSCGKRSSALKKKPAAHQKPCSTRSSWQNVCRRPRRTGFRGRRWRGLGTAEIAQSASLWLHCGLSPRARRIRRLFLGKRPRRSGNGWPYTGEIFTNTPPAGGDTTTMDFLRKNFPGNYVMYRPDIRPLVEPLKPNGWCELRKCPFLSPVSCPHQGVAEL